MKNAHGYIWVLLVTVLDLSVLEGKEICMDDLGCFSITDDFKSWKNRPFNVLPHDRFTINTKFNLYTADNPKERHRLSQFDVENIKKSGIDNTHKTIFIVHGFMDHTLYGPWMEELKDHLLLSSKYNVIIVDWSGGNTAPYFQATANTRVVGAEIALLIQKLAVVGIKPEDCHIIGHSLGSHIAGYAGERLNKLGRITGLDPAEPYFQNMPPSVRLDPTDADFVDVIHSDSKSILFLGLGMSQLVGHADFFPNNGRDQPGCIRDKFITLPLEGIINGIRRFVACNHQRSVDFMIHSINFKSIPQVGFPCLSWDDFTKGKCATCGKNGTQCAIMGMRAIEFKDYKDNNNSLKLYLKTSSIKPYWLAHYQVSVKMHKPLSGSKDRTGKLQLTLTGSMNDIISPLNSKKMEFVHGSTYTYLLTSNKKLGDLKSITLMWESSSLLTMFLSKDIYVEYVEVVPMNYIDPRRYKKKFCDDPNKPVKHKVPRTLLYSTKC